MFDWFDELEKYYNDPKPDNDEGNEMDEVSGTMTSNKIVNARIQSFLDLIGFSEGTDRVKGSDNGYNVIVGGGLFDDYSDHPRVLVDLPNLGIKSTAAGRYQILSRYWDHYAKALKLPDFSPKNQDKYALNMFREVKALGDIEDGRIEDAIRKCSSRWASFPGAGYGQHEYSMRELLNKFDEFMTENLKKVN